MREAASAAVSAATRILAAVVLGLAGWNAWVALRPRWSFEDGLWREQAAAAALLVALRAAAGGFSASRLSLRPEASALAPAPWGRYLAALAGIGLVVAWTSRQTLAFGFYAEDWATLHLAKRLAESRGPVELLRSLFDPAATKAYLAQWRPAFWLTWAADYALWGERAEAYRWTNLLLHWAFAGAVGAFALAAMRSLGVAVLAALLFALHPARLETLTELTQRHIMIEGACVLGAAAILLTRLRRGLGGASPATLSLLALAAMARETWLLFFPVAAATLALAGRRFSPARILATLLPAGALAGAYLAYLIGGYYGGPQHLTGSARSLNRVRPDAAALATVYGPQLARELLPGSEVFAFGRVGSPEKGSRPPTPLRMLFGSLACAFVALKRRWDARALLFAAAWIAAFVLPAPLYIWPITQSRYYEASAAAALLLAAWIWEEPFGRLPRVAFGALAAALLAAISLSELPATSAAAGTAVTARQIAPLRESAERLPDDATVYVLAPLQAGAAWRAGVNWLVARYWNAPNRDKTFTVRLIGEDLRCRRPDGGEAARFERRALVGGETWAAFVWSPRDDALADRTADLRAALARREAAGAPLVLPPPDAVSACAPPSPPGAVADDRRPAAPGAACREASWEFAPPLAPAAFAALRADFAEAGPVALSWRGRPEAGEEGDAILAERDADGSVVFRLADSLYWALTPEADRLTLRWAGSEAPPRATLRPEAGGP